MISNCFTPVIIIAGALYLKDLPVPLDAGRVFAVLAAVTLASNPLNRILTTYPALRSLMSCIDSIDSYITQQEREDKRATTPLWHPAVVDDSEKPDEKSTAIPPPYAPIDLLNTAFMHVGAEDEVMQNVTVSIPHRELTIATGATGSGKTSCLKTVLGETVLTSGELFVEDGPIAFCDQKAWLSSGTIKDNIVGKYPLDEAWYQSVLRYCCLVDDLRRLAEGDQTNVGSDGSKLSGGQRQRVVSLGTFIAINSAPG